MKRKIFIFIILANCLFLFAISCSSGKLVLQGSEDTYLCVNASVISAYGGGILVKKNSISGEKITTASVKVNGIDFPYSATYNSYYKWQDGFHVNEGGTVEIVVSWNGITVKGYGTIPYLPTVSSPMDDANLSISNTVTINWSFDSPSKNPDYIKVAGTDPYYYSNDLSGDINTFIIPKNTFTIGNGYIYIYTYKNGLTFTGPAAPSSNILTRSFKAVMVTFTP